MDYLHDQYNSSCRHTVKYRLISHRLSFVQLLLEKLSPSQLHSRGGSTQLYVHPENAKKIADAKRKGKGTRINISTGAINHDLEEMAGASVWSWLKDKAYPWIKKNWNVLKPVVSAGADALATLVPATASTRQTIKELSGVGIQRKYLTKGSAEMKEHMAMLRARRGGSFKL